MTNVQGNHSLKEASANTIMLAGKERECEVLYEEQILGKIGSVVLEGQVLGK